MKTMLSTGRSPACAGAMWIAPALATAADLFLLGPSVARAQAADGGEVPSDPAAAAVDATAINAATDPSAATAVAGVLPHDLSPWGMFLSADIVVQAVMVGLALASVVTWTVWLAKTAELLTARRRLGRTTACLADAESLREAAAHLATETGPARRLVMAAAAELRQSADALDDSEGVKERVASRLGRIEAATGRAMLRGTGLLATIGSTAPFVGLFGTVWGIMNSFIGISKAQTTNLAVVAPGIAEALLATALGLVAAIPAVVIYNHFARSIAAYRAQVADSSSAVLRLLSRDLSRGLPFVAEQLKAAE